MSPKVEKPPLKVAIIGYTPHKAQAPWNDPSWEFWMLNDLYMQMQGIPQPDPRRVRWFELHPWEEKDAEGKPSTYSVDRNHSGALRALVQQGGKVYLQEERPEVPGAVRFPYDLVYDYYKNTLGGNLKYFTNTISFEIALALMEGATEIGLWGVDMMTGGGASVNNEYGFQRPSCEYWIGFCEGRGVRFHLPVQSDLLKSAFVYGDYAGNNFRKKLEYELGNARQVVATVNQQQMQAEAHKNQMIGRAAAFEQMLNTWMPGDNGHPEVAAPMPGAQFTKPPVPAPMPIQPHGSDGDQPTNRLAAQLKPPETVTR